MEKFKGIIYIVTNIENNKVYIGQSIRTLEKRKYFHYMDAKNGSNQFFHKALRKYDENSFIWEIIEECNNEQTLFEREIYWIAFYNSTNPEKGYNLSEGGSNPRLKGERNGMYGKTHTNDVKQLISIKNSGKSFSHKKYQNINIEIIIKEYKELTLSLKELSIKYNIDPQKLRRIFKQYLSKEELLFIGKYHKSQATYKRFDGKYSHYKNISEDVLNQFEKDLQEGTTCKDIYKKYNIPFYVLFARFQKIYGNEKSQKMLEIYKYIKKHKSNKKGDIV